MADKKKEQATLGDRPTLLRPPEPDSSKAPIENALDVTELAVLGPDIFTNTRQLWHPPNARGIYGGAVIAQCLASAQRTVPDEFLVHSCHCYFLLAGSATIPILFHVERVRDGRSFATRTVQARQRGRCIFTTTVSFARLASGGVKQVSHKAPMPPDVAVPEPSWDSEPEWARGGPVQSRRIQILGAPQRRSANEPPAPELPPPQRRCRQWMRARGSISAGGGRNAHLNALAYMSDSYFIGTVSRVHGLWRFPFKPEDVPNLPEDVQRQVSEYNDFEGMGDKVEDWVGRDRVGMVVSLDHSIYFHEPLRVQADDWMFAEMESPWAGEGRGVVMQRIFARDGTLLASCFQEGVVRLQQDGSEKEAKL